MRAQLLIYRSVLALAALTAFASSAKAQRAEGPYAGVLNTQSAATATQSLDLRGSLYGAWDDTLSRRDGGVEIDERFLRSGGAGGASGSLTHSLRSPRLQWQSGAASSMRMYGTQSGATAATFNGQTTLTSNVSRRVSLSAGGGLTYSPYYDIGPTFDGRLSNVGAYGGGFGVATEAERNLATSGAAGMSIRLSRRATIDFSGGAQRHRFLDNDDISVNSWSAGGRFNHTLTRSLSFHAGFGRSTGRYRGGSRDAVTSDNIDVGINYGDTLTFARRTALTFGTSTSAVRWNDATYYRLNGTAALTRGFGRSGATSLRYERSTVVDPAFREPVLSDSVSAGVSDQLGSRTTWSGQVGYNRGDIGFDSSAGHFSSYSAGGSVNVAVTRRVGFFTDYSVFRYTVPPGATVFTSLERFSRQSVTAGLSVWLPLISERSSSDSR